MESEFGCKTCKMTDSRFGVIAQDLVLLHISVSALKLDLSIQSSQILNVAIDLIRLAHSCVARRVTQISAMRVHCQLLFPDQATQHTMKIHKVTFLNCVRLARLLHMHRQPTLPQFDHLELSTATNDAALQNMQLKSCGVRVPGHAQKIWSSNRWIDGTQMKMQETESSPRGCGWRASLQTQPQPHQFRSATYDVA
jgi:hypothetical protein